MKSSLRLLAIILMPFCGCLAQSGFVRSAGQPIPGATITIVQADQKLSTVTDADGHYAFPPLAAGTWTASVEMFGFQALSKSVDYAAQNEQPVNFDLELKPSALPQRARQNAAGGTQAGGTQAMDQQIQNALNTQQSAERAPATATTGSNESFLVSGSLSPGVQDGMMADSGPDVRLGGPGGIADAGGNQTGSPFAQQNGGAEGGFGGPGGGGGGPGGFGGRGSGFGGPGGPAGERRRPGSNQPRGAFGNYRRRNQQIRGQASFSLQNSELNAKPFSLNGLDIPQAAYAQSRFSLIVGGPLVIPKIVKDPATQFFLTYFGTRAKTPRLFTETVPTAAERNGDFSQATQSLGTNATSVPVTIYDPATHAPYPGNVLPRLNPIAVRLLNYYPLPNQPGNANNYQFETAQPSNTDNVGLRIQRSVTQRDRLFLNVQYQRRDSRTAQPFGYSDAVSGYGLTTTLGWTRNITTNLVNNFQIRFSRNRTEVTPFFESLGDVSAELGIPGTSSNPLNYGPPTLNFTNFASLPDSNYTLSRNQSQGFTDSLTLVHGKHSVSLGGGYTRPDQAVFSDPNGRGTFNFTGVATSQINSAQQTVTGTGYDLADFLLGYPQSSSIQYSGQNDYFLQNQFNLYAQDEWKGRSNFTVILGVRYDYFAPIHEKYGRLANLEIAPGFTSVTPVTANGSGGLIQQDLNNFSPRLAIAWKVTQLKRSTVVRAGYGIYYNGQAYLAFASQLANQPPFAVSNNVNTSAGNVLTLQRGFLTTTPREVTNTFAVGSDYRTPYAGTWNVSVQHDLGAGFFTELGYLGTKGTGLDVRSAPFLQSQATNVSGFTLDQSIGNSIFNALQVRVNRRFNRGISFNAFYQFSKSIDDSSTFGGAGNTVAQNWLDIAAERGLSSFDVRHQFQMGFNWTSPVAGPGSHLSGENLPGRLLKDWQITGQVTAQTGNPLTARVLGNSQQLAVTGGIGSGRADATGEAITGGPFFNLDAFTVPVSGIYGNAGRNTIPGPGTFSLNLALARSFTLAERRRLEFRWETNNLLNHVNYTNLYTVVNATNYGLPSAAAGMRTMQAVVRLRF